MSPRLLFDVILKVLGIFFIRNVLEALSRAVSALIYFPQYDSVAEGWYHVGVTLPSLILFTIFSWLLIFRTHTIISVLRIERSLGEKPYEINIERKLVLTVAVVVLGGWLLVEELPEFFRLMVLYYQERIMYDRMVRPDFSYPAVSLVKIILGLALVVFHGPVVQVIEAVSKNRIPLRWQSRSRAKPRNRVKKETAE